MEDVNHDSVAVHGLVSGDTLRHCGDGTCHSPIAEERHDEKEAKAAVSAMKVFNLCYWFRNMA
jgi:hypothetical protein